MISGLQSTISAGTAGRGYWSTTTAAEQEAKENPEAHRSLWVMVGGNVHLPLLSPAWLCFSGRVSVASHKHTHPSTSWALAPAANLRRQWVAWHRDGNLQPFPAEVSGPGCAGLWLWKFVPMSENTETIIKTWYCSSYLQRSWKLKREKKYPSPLRGVFFPSFFRLRGSTAFQKGLNHRAGNTDYSQKKKFSLIDCKKTRQFMWTSIRNLSKICG